MKKLHALNLALCFSVLNGASGNNESKSAVWSQGTEKPNFIIIMADDLGYGDIGCFGNTTIKTPHLDRLAKEGVRFIDFHSNGAVCSPTRAALLTGKYQQRTGITGVITAKNHRDIGLPLSETTIAEALKNVGYATAVFGKWHLGYPKEFNPIHQGFDEFIGFVSGNVDYHSHVDQEGFYDWWNGDELTNQRGYTTDLINSNANDFIKRNKENPFLLYIAHEAPHSPYQNRESKPDRFPGGISGVDFPVPGSEENIPAMYKDMVEIMDENIGKTMELLRELELDNKTVVIFCSDNGANRNGSNGNLRGFKGSVWEGGHRVPAIIRWPGSIKPDWTSNETVLTMDIFPTVMEFAGLANYSGVDGISVADHLLNRKPLPPRSLFWQHGNDFAVRKNNWKLIVPNTYENPELYDLKSDVKELNDVSGENQGMVKELIGELKSWEKSVFEGVKIIP